MALAWKTCFPKRGVLARRVALCHASSNLWPKSSQRPIWDMAWLESEGIWEIAPHVDTCLEKKKRFQQHPRVTGVLPSDDTQTRPRWFPVGWLPRGIGKPINELSPVSPGNLSVRPSPGPVFSTLVAVTSQAGHLEDNGHQARRSAPSRWSCVKVSPCEFTVSLS